jgi:hypothetical protein
VLDIKSKIESTLTITRLSPKLRYNVSVYSALEIPQMEST